MIKAEVLNQKIRLDAEVVAANSVNFLEIKFILDNSWNGTVKTAVFENEGFKTAVIMEEGNPLYLGDNTCLVPHEVIKPPFFSVSINGIADEKVITTVPSKIKVYESGELKGDNPKEYTPSEFEQLAAIYEETKQIAQSVRADADNGLFKGDKGNKGDKGDKGDTGPQGPQGIQGVPGAVTPEFTALADGVKNDRKSAESAAEQAVAAAKEIEENKANYLNVLKNNMSGKIIRAKDVSLLENSLAVSLSSDTITDFSNIALIKCSKNIFNIGSLSDYKINYLTLSISENSLTATKTQDSAISHIFNTKKLPSGTYHIKASSSTDVIFLSQLFDENGNILTSNEITLSNGTYNSFYKAWICSNRNNTVVTIPEKVAYWNFGLVFQTDKTISDIQISVGNSDESYETFNGSYYTPSADGKIEPILASSNDITLLTNNPEVQINLDYSADLKLYIDNKLA